MTRRLILTLFTVASLLFAGMAALSPVAVFAADPRDEVCKGIDAASGNGCYTDISLTAVIRNLINVFSVIVGIVAVVMIVVAGFKYITSGGDSGNMTSAKNTLVYAIIGLVVAALAQVIVRFVLQSVNKT